MNDSVAAEIVNVRFNELRMKNPPKYCFIYVTFMLQRYLITINLNYKHLQPKNDLFFLQWKTIINYIYLRVNYMQSLHISINNFLKSFIYKGFIESLVMHYGGLYLSLATLRTKRRNKIIIILLRHCFSFNYFTAKYLSNLFKFLIFIWILIINSTVSFIQLINGLNFLCG